MKIRLQEYAPVDVAAVPAVVVIRSILRFIDGLDFAVRIDGRGYRLVHRGKTHLVSVISLPARCELACQSCVEQDCLHVAATRLIARAKWEEPPAEGQP